MIKNIFLIITTLFLFSCAHHRDVRPQVSGIHKVIIKTDNKQEGARNAIEQANHFCEKRQKSAAFVSENKKYTGDMKEKDYRTGKKISKAAKTLGGMVRVFGGSKESNAGGILGLGGIVADGVLGDGYTITMKFRCI